MCRHAWLHPRERWLNWPGPWLAVAILLLGCEIVGCCGTTTTLPVVRCPEPSDGMIHEILARRVPPATEEYLARVENVCAALLVGDGS